MKIKDKIFNKVADFMYKYKSSDMDKISDFVFNGKVKGAIISVDSEYIKDIPKKEMNGLIDVDILLTQEIKNNDMQSIVFCDNGRIITLTNQVGASYIEDENNDLKLANESVYIMCSSKQTYNEFKNYITQSSKWHKYFEMSDVIPEQKIFEKLFGISKEEEKNNVIYNEEMEKEELKNNLEIYNDNYKGNFIQIDGVISQCGKEFIKKDDKKAKYINISQEDIYNGNTKNYSITVSLEENILEKFGDYVEIGDKVKVAGKLVNYFDKSNKPQSIVKCESIEILEKVNQDTREVR